MTLAAEVSVRLSLDEPPCFSWLMDGGLVHGMFDEQALKICKSLQFVWSFFSEVLILSGVGHKDETEILITKILILSNETFGLSTVADLIGFVTYLLGAERVPF